MEQKPRYRYNCNKREFEETVRFDFRLLDPFRSFMHQARCQAVHNKEIMDGIRNNAITLG